MAKRQSKMSPTWTDVKAKLVDFDRAALLALVQDLYAAGKDNQTFLHARFGLGKDVLKPYKETINRWISPDLLCRQNVSVSKGKQAIADYRKAVGQPEGLAELMVYYCEQAAGFCREYGNDDYGYFSSLLSMFGQALKLINTLPATSRSSLVNRLQLVREISQKFGYGMAEDMDSLFGQIAAT
jgi:hypothetical protein